MLKKPTTRKYPKTPTEWHERTRGRVRIKEELCILCGICVKKCPTNAVAVNRAERMWTIERMRCIHCGSCIEACPKKCLIMVGQYTTPDTKKTIDNISIPEPKKVESPESEKSEN